VTWIVARHGHNLGLSVLQDSQHVPPGRRPGFVGGFVPDVIAQTVPGSFYIIGEAKSSTDLDTPHSRRQLQGYLRHLSVQSEPQLVMATPLLMIGLAKSIVRQLKRGCGAGNVDVVFLTSGYQSKFVEC